MKTLRYTGWGRVLAAEGPVARPERVRPADWPTGPAIGSLRSYGDAALNSQGPVLQTTRLDRCLAFDPETGRLTAEAGVRLAEILRLFAPRGWMPAVLPGTAHATLGGAIAADVHGKNHETAGTFGGHVEAIELAGPDGVARRVSAEAEPEVFRATFGGMGLTGRILSATIRLAPCPGGEMRVNEQPCNGLDSFMAAFEKVDAPYSVGWIDAAATGPRLGRGILETAEFVDGAPVAPPGKVRAIPRDAPGALLSGPVVKAFNGLYYNRVSAQGRRLRRPLASFFFPLDGLSDWNRLYGKRGFHQFQCILPERTARETLRAMLARIAAARLASPLAVLKRLGAGRAGPMSFPMPGYTLAVDLPNRGGATALVEALCRHTAEAGGRIYLAKDSVCPAELIPEMYPEAPAFAALLREIDPGGSFETDLARRLALRDIR